MIIHPAPEPGILQLLHHLKDLLSVLQKKGNQIRRIPVMTLLRTGQHREARAVIRLQSVAETLVNPDDRPGSLLLPADKILHTSVLLFSRYLIALKQPERLPHVFPLTDASGKGISDFQRNTVLCQMGRNQNLVAPLRHSAAQKRKPHQILRILLSSHDRRHPEVGLVSVPAFRHFPAVPFHLINLHIAVIAETCKPLYIVLHPDLCVVRGAQAVYHPFPGPLVADNGFYHIAADACNACRYRRKHRCGQNDADNCNNCAYLVFLQTLQRYFIQNAHLRITSSLVMRPSSMAMIRSA